MKPGRKPNRQNVVITDKQIGRLLIGAEVPPAERHAPDVVEYYCTCSTCGRKKQIAALYLASFSRRPNFRGGCASCSAVRAREAERKGQSLDVRDKDMMTRHEAGESLRALATEYKLSHQRVSQILARMRRNSHGVVSMKLVYISGPIGNGNLLHNISQADDAFLALVQAGLYPWNPMLSCFAGTAGISLAIRIAGNIDEWYLQGPSKLSSLPLTFADWIRIDLAWISRADCVLRLPGLSTGADMETAHANKLGIPVFSSVADVVAWAELNP